MTKGQKALGLVPSQSSDILIFDPKPFQDERGQFGRVICISEINEFVPDFRVVQVNRSLTEKKGTIRGMHFQYPPCHETKVIYCLSGSAYDVAVDLRKDSPTFLKWFPFVLESKRNRGVIIPAGFAHGFQSLSDNTELLYFHSHAYNPNAEGRINPLDPVIGISWPLTCDAMSQKDKTTAFLKQDFEGVQI